MPTIFILFGMRFCFYTEDHEPVHVHVIAHGIEAKFNLDPEITLVYNKGLTTCEVRLAKELIAEMRKSFGKDGRKFFIQIKRLSERRTLWNIMKFGWTRLIYMSAMHKAMLLVSPLPAMNVYIKHRMNNAMLLNFHLVEFIGLIWI